MTLIPQSLGAACFVIFLIHTTIVSVNGNANRLTLPKSSHFQQPSFFMLSRPSPSTLQKFVSVPSSVPSVSRGIVPCSMMNNDIQLFTKTSAACFVKLLPMKQHLSPALNGIKSRKQRQLLQSSLKSKSSNRFSIFSDRTRFLFADEGRINNVVLHVAADDNQPPFTQQKTNEPTSPLHILLTNLRTAASEGFGTRARNVASTMKEGDIVVPLCNSDLDLRQSLAGRGVYSGVEYLICNITCECHEFEIDHKNTANDEVELKVEDDQEQNQQKLGTKVNRIATVRPAYPLRAHLERSDWPVSIEVSEVPLWLSKATYEAGTAVGTLILAGTYLIIASILATFVRVVVVPSESMVPALMPNDVVLVTRSIFPPKVGDVVFFDPPSELDASIANSKLGRAVAGDTNNGVSGEPGKVNVVSTKGKQFLKRVVGVPGEKVGVWDSNPFAVLCETGENEAVAADCKYRVDRTGEYARPEIFPSESWNRATTTVINMDVFSDTDTRENEIINQKATSTLAKNEYFVAGDNGLRSVDSRVWGPLKKNYLFGTANFVLYPIEHFGTIEKGPISYIEEHVIPDNGYGGNGPWKMYVK